MLVTDSRAGVVFEIALADGAVAQWTQHEHLLPLDGNCGPRPSAASFTTRARRQP